MPAQAASRGTLRPNGPLIDLKKLKSVEELPKHVQIVNLFDKDKLFAEQLKHAINEGLIDRTQANKIKNHQITKHQEKHRQTILKTQKFIPSRIQEVISRSPIRESRESN